MTLTNQIADLESQHVTDREEVGRLKEQVARQQGALLESRAQNAQILKELVEARELIGTYQSHFHTFHGSAEHLKQQEKSLAAAAMPELPPMRPPPPDPQTTTKTLRSKISARIARKNGDTPA